MRQSYLKNAALLTGSDVVLRLAGMGLRIWLANELGGEGMGLYQLVLAVYSLFVTLATAGVSVPAHGRGTQRPGLCPRCGPGNAAASAGGGACAGAVCRRAAADDSESCGPVVAWRCPRRRCFARFSAGNAVDGGCAVFSSPGGM